MIVARKKTSRFELRADAAWIARVEAEAERLGLSAAAYVRMAVAEKMERERRAGRQEAARGKDEN